VPVSLAALERTAAAAAVPPLAYPTTRYWCCRASSMTVLAPLSTVMTLWMGA
jgi:hypothetical protein